MELDGDPAAFHTVLQQTVQYFGHRFGGRGPLLRETRGPDRALHLRSACQDFDAPQPVQKGLAQAPAVRRLDPAAETDGGRRHHDVGRLVEQVLGRGEQLAVVGERHDAQRGGVDDHGSAALEERPELVGPAGGRDPHGEPRERPVFRLRCPIHQMRPVWSIGSI